MTAATQGSFVKKTGWERLLVQKDDAPEPLRDKRSYERAVQVKEKNTFFDDKTGSG